jgi:predicted kinase
MDLYACGHVDLGRRLVNRYLEITGDYGGVAVLRFHLVYRAMVRAKVACMRAAQGGADAADARQRSRRHLELAADLVRAARPAVVLMHGFAGCGKTTLSQTLLETVDAVRIRTDIERKRLHGYAAKARTGSGIATGLYSPDASRAAYQHVAALTRAIIEAGYTAIVDGAFLRRWQRDVFAALAAKLQVPLVIVDFVAPQSVLRERVARRAAAREDASEADAAVLAHQLASHDPLEADERRFVVAVDAEAPPSSATASVAWRDLLERLGQPMRG